MAENSAIEWTDHTFNPWIGCKKVSSGCANCYAESLMDKRWGKVEWGPQGKRSRTSDANWRKPLAWNRKAEREGVRYRVFCASLADVFEEKPDQGQEMFEWLQDLLTLIEQTPLLDWLLLTKRPELVEGKLEEATGRSATRWLSKNRHVWVGTSVENQEVAAARIEHLRQIPAAVRFLSCEPLLGELDLTAWLKVEHMARHVHPLLNLGRVGVDYVSSYERAVDWVIVGGESGPNARPMHPEWVRAIRDQCTTAGVPFFFKQWGEWAPCSPIHPNASFQGGEAFTLPSGGGVSRAKARAAGGALRNLYMFEDEQVMDRIGKKKAGRKLDGREWSEFPATEA